MTQLYYNPLQSFPEPTPFDVDNYIETNMKELTPQQMATVRTNMARSLLPFARPFMAQGYNTVAALNRGAAAFFSHLDSIADYIEASTGFKKGDLFDRMATIANNNADHWRKRAEDVGITFVDEIVSEAVGGFVPGVSQFAMDVGSGFTFPYMQGASEAYKRGDSPFVAGMVEAAKTGTLYGLFKMMHPLKQYLRAPAFGSVFGIEAAAHAPEGQQLKEFVKGAAIGGMYSFSSPGGKMGLNEIKQTSKTAIENIGRREAAEIALEKLQEQRGSISQEPEKRQRKFLKTVEEAKEIDPTLKEKTKEITPQDYFVEPNVESFGKARARIDKDGTSATLDYLKSEVPVSAEKGAVFQEMIKDAQKAGDWDRAIELVELYDVQAREAGRFIQTAATWTKVLGPEGFIRWANKQLAAVQNKYGWMDTIFARKPTSFELTKAEQKIVFEKYREISESEKQPSTKFDFYDTGETFEIGGRQFSVDAAKERIRNRPRDVEDFDISQVAEPGIQGIRVTKKGVENADINMPVIMGTEKGQPFPVDGWHRIARAKREGVDHIKKIVLTEKETAEISGRKPEKELNDTIALSEPLDRADATLELIDMVAQKVPPSVTELIDAYRYQNMLSSPKTQARNIGENIFNTFVSRPADIATMGAIDYFKSGLFGKQREAYVKEAPQYLKAAINSVPNAIEAFTQTAKLSKTANIGKPELGIEAKTEFEKARLRQIPTSLTLVQRFMEASDKFNIALISGGEMSRLMKKGVPEAEAHARATALAEELLYRGKPEPETLSKSAQAIQELAGIVESARKMKVIGPIAKWYVPFLRTPANKAIQMVERSPLGLLRDPRKFEKSSLAKAFMGSVVTGLGAHMAMMGETTWSAPEDADGKALFYASGRRPYSVKIGEKWIPIWYLGPFALAFGIPMAIKHYVQDEKKALTRDGVDKLLKIVEATAQFVGSQSSTQNIGALFSALHGDIDYTFESQTGFTVQQVIPASSLIRYINTIIDPVYRKPKVFVENIEANLPVLSKNLDAYMEPFLKEARREPINYFLPYDVGTADKAMESFYELHMMKQQFKAATDAIKKQRKAQ